MKTESKYREALKELILTKPLEEITVQVLCDKVNTPRQTSTGPQYPVSTRLPSVPIYEPHPPTQDVDTKHQ